MPLLPQIQQRLLILLVSDKNLQLLRYWEHSIHELLLVQLFLRHLRPLLSGLRFPDEVLGPTEFVPEDGFSPPWVAVLGAVLGTGWCLFFLGFDFFQDQSAETGDGDIGGGLTCALEPELA